MVVSLIRAQNLITISSLSILWGLETWLPAALRREYRLRHAMRNLTLGLLNALLLALVAGPLITFITKWASESGLGLLRLVSISPVPATVLAILLLDGWMYLWRRANHRLAFLWRFHRVHHSDPEMDVTTAVRFHLGEILISLVLRLALIPLLGVTLSQLLLYDALLMPAILFHHSNLRFPERFDRVLRAMIASPAMHRIHHSRLQVETDSNYSSIFSFWDRLGRSFRLRPGRQPVSFGLDEFDSAQRQRISDLLLIPFIPPTSERASRISGTAPSTGTDQAASRSRDS